MSSAKNSKSVDLHTPQTTSTTSPDSEMLTKSELEQLQRVKREQSEHAAEAFKHLRPKGKPAK